MRQNKTPLRRCCVDGCNKEYYARGYCATHYARYRKHGDPNIVLPRNNGGGRRPKPPTKCLVEGCDRLGKTLGLCSKHYQRYRRYGDPNVVKELKYSNRVPRKPRICVIDGCNEPHHANGYCTRHYNRYRKYGDTNVGERRGPLPDDKNDVIVSLHENGKTYREIGDMFGISRQRAQQIFKKILRKGYSNG